jgi:Protein of unknown function (DUF2997)
MPQEKDKEPIAIVSACMRADGIPTFAYHVVEVTSQEAANGVHYYFAEAQLLEEGYEEPFVHFDAKEAPLSSRGGPPVLGPVPSSRRVALGDPFGGSLMSRVIEVLVSPQGETTVQTKGYVGGDCLQASKFLEQALGAAIADRKTAEFFQINETAQHQEYQA